jgi:pimeloyl-ACP methyl ester carboxylesterase
MLKLVAGMCGVVHKGDLAVELERHAIVHGRTHGATEEHGFAVLEDARLAYVHHRPRDPAQLRVVLIGPIGAERERAYRTLVDFSRALTDRGYEVFRYDHRGLGESEGDFDEATIGLWAEDARRVVQHLHTIAPLGLTTALVGVRVGALIASELFAEGCGDAVVFMGQGDGQSLLRDASRRALVADLVHGNAAKARHEESLGASHAELFAGYAAIAAGREARVDGYLWKPGLIAEAAKHVFRLPDSGEGRPWLQLDLRGSVMRIPDKGVTASAAQPRLQDVSSSTAHRLVIHAPRFWESSPQLVPQDTRWFDALGAWFEQVRTSNVLA